MGCVGVGIPSWPRCACSYRHQVHRIYRDAKGKGYVLATYRLERPQADAPKLVLYPLRQSFFARLEVTFADDLKSVRRLTFTERNGDAVSIVFNRTLINAALRRTLRRAWRNGERGQ